MTDEHTKPELRDYFAGQVLNVLASLNDTQRLLAKKGDEGLTQICAACYEYADAMLKAREK